MAKFLNCFNSTVGEGDEIKSFLYASDGTAITQTGGALDINIASGSLTVTENDVYAEDSAHTSGDEGGFVLSLRVDDLASVPASVLAGTEGDYQAFITGPSGELLVGANNLDIRDLSDSTDSVSIGDGTDTLAINSDGSINVSETKPTTFASAQPIVGTSAAAIVTKLTNQCKIYVRNEGSEPVYVGPTGVTTLTGYKIGCGEVECFEGDADLFAIAGTATAVGAVHVFQVAA